NPVDVAAMRRSRDFDRSEFRRQHGLSESDVVLAFVALGQFERKGLPLLMEALHEIHRTDVKLLVVGRDAQKVLEHLPAKERPWLERQIVFAGMQHDVRPWLWASDAFALPSFYEVFPLSCLEAAAAALPLIVTPINGVEDFVVDGENGILVGHWADDVARGIRRFL